MNDISKLHYYSERGMVNAIVLSIYKYKEAMYHFLKCIKGIDGKPIFKDIRLNDIKEISIFNEFSLNDFGDPDLIIRIEYSNKEPQLLFIEAKVKTYEDSVKEHKIFVKNSYSEKGNSSRINFQLRLKQRFVKAYLNKSNDNIISKKDNDFDYKERSLKKNSIIKYLNDYIMKNIEFNNVFYVSMTSDDNNPYEKINKDLYPLIENEEGYNNLCYLLYRDINIDKNDNSRKDIVLYNDTKDMFTFAEKLANDTYVSEDDDGE